MNMYKRNGKSGMTLIEILIVVSLLGILAGVLVRSLGSSMESGKKATARLFCDTTARNMVLMHNQLMGTLPADYAAMITSKVATAEALKDPWGREHNRGGYQLLPVVIGGAPAAAGGGAPAANAVFAWIQYPDGAAAFAPGGGLANVAAAEGAVTTYITSGDGYAALIKP